VERKSNTKGLQDPPPLLFFSFREENILIKSSIPFSALWLDQKRGPGGVKAKCVVLKYIIRNDKTTNNQMEKDW
jgi:hypothetical protein